MSVCLSAWQFAAVILAVALFGFGVGGIVESTRRWK